MSIANTMLAHGQANLVGTYHGDEFLILGGEDKGKRFTAILDSEPVIDIGEASNDPRMQDVIRCTKPAPALNGGDLIQSNGVKWKVLKIQNNESMITTDFWLEQQL